MEIESQLDKIRDLISAEPKIEMAKTLSEILQILEVMAIQIDELNQRI
jgi:hypothetical protein